MKKLILIIFALTVIFTSCVFQSTNEKVDLKISFKNDFIELSWNKITSAEKYEIYKRNKNDENYKLLKIINSNETTKYADYDFDPHQTYIYQIIYYKNNFISDPVEKTIEIPNRLPSPVTIISPENNSTVKPKNLKIIWNKSIDKDNDELEYTIFIKDKNDVLLYSEKSTDTEYNIDLKHSKTYKLRIDVSDGYDTTKGEEITFYTTDPDILLDTPELNISNVSTDTIQLNWSEIKNATSYEIYRKEETEDDFSLLKTVEELSYIDTKLKRKTTYSYKIRAIQEENDDIIAVSNYSEVKPETTINNEPVFTSFSPSNNATDVELDIKLSWKAYDIDGIIFIMIYILVMIKQRLKIKMKA
ncbi:hypothetical protein [Marinitoga lauensis]|uniref:hypothetical protein n=1 Tax=Marinitoga lauensis TaxID=2201189 RepID=UPI00101325E1|nr:hypothetical protein [Marinitoga lauensis]